MLTEITKDDPHGLDAIAEMHMELLEFGPMAGLGKRFVREICYRGLLSTGYFRVVSVSIDQRPAGFVAFTHKSKLFHEIGLRQSRLGLLKELGLALLTDPRRLGALIESIKVLQTRRAEPEKSSSADGEVICLAVRPEYLTGKFRREYKRRLSEELVVHAARELKQQGVEEMRMIVDDDNKAVLFLYHALGAEFEAFKLGDRPSVIASFCIEELLQRFPAAEAKP